jgi:hypothetical protein
VFRRIAPVVAVTAASLSAGCGALDSLENGGSTVFVFSTHHATPDLGTFPFRGGDQMPRVFDTDQGWTVTLLESYVTLSAVTLVRCNDDFDELTMFWGPCPEDLREEDLETLSVAGKRVSPGDFCGLEVEYGPYMTPVIDDSAEAESTRHQTPDNESVTGATVYLRGAAQMDDETPIQFELRATESGVAYLDLGDIEGPGDPLTVDHEEDFPPELTVSKTYDRFFDGIDFNVWDPAELEGRLVDILIDESKVNLGLRVLPPGTDDGGA